MKVAVKKVDVLKRELAFEVPRERVAEKLEDVYKEITRSAKIKGFRPGKAPRHIVEAEYASFAKEEAIKQMIPEVYQEGLAQEALSPLDYPQIENVDWDEGVLKFTAVIEIKPEFKVVNYKGIEVVRKGAHVTDDEVKATMAYFQQGQNKDEATPVDDDFAKGLGYPNLAAFTEALKRQMEIDKDRHNRMDVERQITDALVRNTKMVVPQSLVVKQLEYRISDLKKRLKSQGLADDAIEQKEKEMRKDLKESVEKDVKLFLIFDRIAQEENLEVKDGESLPVKVMEFLMKEARWKDEDLKQPAS